MASSVPGGKPEPEEEERNRPLALSQGAFSPHIKDTTPFPAPDIYFRVYESEEDEPEAKIRRDVGKLYERWQQKYGRRWPEHGMNTEDLVWLAEEAYKDPLEQQLEIGEGQPSGPVSLAEQGLQVIEADAYPGEFIPEPFSEDEPSAVAKRQATAGQPDSAAADPATRKRLLSNYEATAAGATWVTDEFESVDYEAGNLESLWGTYLWDREGKPTLMPSGPPNEAQGEESEDWDDFYGSYRPRHVNTEEAREAVWATDEYESDEDNTESEWEPDYVGAGMGLVREDPTNPQYSLRHSNHPLAPFPGEPLKWISYVYDDGTTYEGLSRDAVPHGMGVMIFGNGTGGGFHFRDVRRGDKFEGEFQVGYAHGLGQMTSENRGEVYIGEFFAGQRHGCGMRIDMQPYYYLLQRGEDPVAAYRKTYDNIMRNIEFRTWYRNKPLGDDHEQEIILHAIRDDLDDPWKAVMKGIHHESKLKIWQGMNSEEKALLKAGEIIDQVATQRAMKPNMFGFAQGYPEPMWGIDEDGGVFRNLPEDGNATDFDTVDIMVGEDTDGGPGLGWVDDGRDTGLFQLNQALQEQINAEVLDDKIEEDEDKEMILGEDLLNPFTGLTLKDYLDGREGEYKELMAITGAASKLRSGLTAAENAELNGDGMWLANAGDYEGNSYVARDLMDSPEVLMQLALDSVMPRRTQEFFQNSMARSAAQFPERVGGRPEYASGKDPYTEDTDTRFETDSDVMDLCDMAEILGTVDEAREIVAKARMWRFKPDGEVTLRFSQDAQGAPVNLMQDPLHYPHGTKFMAPGPLGQCHPVPEDPAIRDEMLKAASNHAVIYQKYNFDYDPEPGSAQWQIDQRIARAEELYQGSLQRLAEDVEDELLAEEAQAQQAGSGSNPRGPQPMAALAQAGSELSHQPTTSPSRQTATAARRAPSDSQDAASGSGLMGPFGQRSQGAAPGGMRWQGPFGPAPFASMGLGMSVSMGTASRVVLQALTKAAKAVPTSRPRLVRPSTLRAAAAKKGSAHQQ